MPSVVAALSILPQARHPQQIRSIGSLARMIAGAQRLLLERGSGEFTLADISRVSHVSIGSIYHRFESKEELLRAVHQKLMEELDAEQAALVQRIRDAATSLTELLALLVEETAELLRRRARALKPMMACANGDAAIAAAGKASHGRFQALFSAAFQSYRAEIRHDDAQEAAGTCFKMIYAAVARDLGFEAAHIAAKPGEWAPLKAQLFALCLSYLTTPPRIALDDVLRRVSLAPAVPAKAAPRRKASAPG